MPVVGAALRAVLDLFYPEHCCVCGALSGQKHWSPAGERVPGLRCWDRPHLCRECRNRLADRAPVARTVDDGQGTELNVAAGCATNQDIVGMVAAMKYHGLRGAGWPLADIAAVGLQNAAACFGPAVDLVAVPLHPTRQRERGFNQAEVIARLVARSMNLRCRTGLVSRSQRTRQQAKIAATANERGSNVAGAFIAKPVSAAGERTIIVVDDLITSGGTMLAVAAALNAAGWSVGGGLAVGMSAGSPAPGTVPSDQGCG